MPRAKHMNRPGSESAPARRTGYLSVVLLSLAGFLVICLRSYDPRDQSFNVATDRGEVSNLCGLVGSYIADLLAQLMGLASYIVPIALVVLAVGVFRHVKGPLTIRNLGATLLVIAGVCTLFERWSRTGTWTFSMENPGGTLGAFLHNSFFVYLGTAGEVLLCSTLVIVGVLKLCRVSLDQVGGFAWTASSLAKALLKGIALLVTAGWAKLRKRASTRTNSSQATGETPLTAQAASLEAVPDPHKAFEEHLGWDSRAAQKDDPTIYDDAYCDDNYACSWEKLSFLLKEDEL
ncbi:DNA translocase FtsK 4TM domain-containing protein [Thermodesulfobacteriota bacterium]